MSHSNTAEKIVSYIHQYSRPEMFEELPLLIGKAFELAYFDGEERIKHCNLRKSRKRSQDRAFYVQEALCSTQSGWTGSVKIAHKHGESYTQLEVDNFLLTAHILPWNQSELRYAKFRSDNAKYNDSISRQLELLSSEINENYESVNEEKLNLLLVACAPAPGQEQNGPTQIKIFVPYGNGKGYHLKIDIEDLISGFSSTFESTEPEDKAWPELRRIMREAEIQGSTDEKDE